MALLQHHDAVTGTEKQHVANDYHRRLHRGERQPRRRSQGGADVPEAHAAGRAAVGLEGGCNF